MLLGLGLLLAGGTGVGALLLGGEVLQTAVLEGDVPVLGHVKFVTSLIFDVGVYLIVVGLVLDILRSLGAELDRRRSRRWAGSGPRGGALVTSPIVLLALVGVLYTAGVYLLLERSLTRVLLGVLVLGNATNVLVIVAGGSDGRGAAGRPRAGGDDERRRWSRPWC